MKQHELFHCPMIDAAPMRSGQKCPADFDLAFILVVAVESRRPDDPAISGINGDQRSPGFQGLAEECPENLFLVTVLDRMLFPNERIRSYGVEVMKILRPKRPELEELALQNGLEIKGHS